MNVDRHTLIRYFLGQCREEEKEAIRQWLESDEKNKKQFIRERIYFDASIVADEKNIRPGKRTYHKRFTWGLLKIASAVLLLVGSGYLFSLFQFNKPEVVVQNIFVPAGSRTSVNLPDGTRVWLNSNTTLKYPNVFAGKHRMVELDGEAYFEVTEDKQKSFIVKTNTYHVEVLGTTFNIEAYANEAVFKTTLFTGKIRLFHSQSGEESYILLPGQTAELIEGDINITADKSDRYRWKDGLIILEDQSFDEIMRLFEKYFDHRIIIQNDKVKNLGYHGKLRIADGIDHAFRVLQNDFHFTYKREPESNVIYIY